MHQPRRRMLRLPMPRPRRSGQVEVPTALNGLDRKAPRIVDRAETRTGPELPAATMRTVAAPAGTRIVVDRAETRTVVAPVAMPTKPGRRVRTGRDKPAGIRLDRQAETDLGNRAGTDLGNRAGTNLGRRPGIDPEVREPTPIGISQRDPSKWR